MVWFLVIQKELTIVEVVNSFTPQYNVLQKNTFKSTDGKRIINILRINWYGFFDTAEIKNLLFNKEFNNKLVIFTFVNYSWDTIISFCDANDIGVSSGGNNRNEISRLHFKVSLFTSWLDNDTDLALEVIGKKLWNCRCIKYKTE